MTAQPLSPFIRSFAAIIAIVAIASLVLQIVDLTGRQGYSLFEAIKGMSRALSILTAGLIAGSFAAIALNADEIPARWIAALVLASGMVAGGYHLLLRDLNTLEGLGAWAGIGLHSLGPALVLLFWLVATPRGQLGIADIPFLIGWPAIYLSYALTRGGIEGVFPYPFLDPLAIGWTPVLWTIARFTAGGLIGAAVLVLLDRALARVLGGSAGRV